MARMIERSEVPPSIIMDRPSQSDLSKIIEGFFKGSGKALSFDSDDLSKWKDNPFHKKYGAVKSSLSRIITNLVKTGRIEKPEYVYGYELDPLVIYLIKGKGR